VVSYSRIFGGGALNELRLGFNRIESASAAPTEGMDFPNPDQNLLAHLAVRWPRSSEACRRKPNVTVSIA
jgi:hypothetical protein